jgi:hypothetical protein
MLIALSTGHAGWKRISRLEKQIALLAEHWQALFTAAVTGQLEVPRGHSVKPEEQALEAHVAATHLPGGITVVILRL